MFWLHWARNTIMPTLLKQNGFVFYFYSREYPFKSAHVHVRYQGRTAVFWLKPEVELLKNDSMRRKEVAKAMEIITENRQNFQEKYHEFFSKNT